MLIILFHCTTIRQSIAEVLIDLQILKLNLEQIFFHQ